MKLPCGVIEDLLPLYHDGVCSKETRKIVEKHVEECFDCRLLLKKMDAQVDVEHDAPDDEGALRAIGKRAKKAGIKRIFVGLLAAAAIVFIGWTATNLTIVPVPTEKISINDLSMTRDGTIVFQLLIDDGKELRSLRIENDDESGTVYLNPMRAVIEKRREGDRYMSLNGQYMFVRLVDENGEYREHFTSMVLEEGTVRLCVGTERDNVVIWEEGKELPLASDYVEALYMTEGE